MGYDVNHREGALISIASRETEACYRFKAIYLGVFSFSFGSDLNLEIFLVVLDHTDCMGFLL